MISGKTKDKEYWGSLIVRAEYYEYWETWVTETCSYTTTCCCDDKGNNCTTTTHYYDCSYCDENNAYWVAYDNAGNSWRISENYYNYLKQKWQSKPKFSELNRSIDNSHGCGDDGDMYYIEWNNKVESSEASVTVHTYENKVQTSKSSFNFENITNKESKQLGLYDYPKFYNYYKQKVILGLDSLNYSSNEIEKIETLYQYFNGYKGPKNKVKIFVCLYFDKPLNIVYKQQSYWDGANQNEIVICISMNKSTKELQWVQAFSFTNIKRVLVDLREDIMNLKKFEPYQIYNVIDKSISENIIYRDFKTDFNYLRVQLNKSNIIWIWVISFIITFISSFYCITNQFGEESISNYYNMKDYLKEFWKKIKYNENNKF